MKISASEMKALGWYVRDRDLRPQLSTPPVMYFTKRKDGTEVKVNLAHIVTDYKAWNEEDKKERARAKLEATRRAEATKAKARITW